MTHIPLAILLPAGAPFEAAFRNDIVQMVLHAGPMVKLVIGLLLVFSIVCWAIILVKFRMLRKAKEDTEDFLELFWERRGLQRLYNESSDLKYSPVVRVFWEGYAEVSRIRKNYAGGRVSGDSPGTGMPAVSPSRRAVTERLERTLKKASIDQASKLERAIGFLATTGNTAPFIGLFGTVWGIMNSFRGIGLTGAANLAVVAPGISEALVATAAGLAAAIPAVVAYNYFSQKIAALDAAMDVFAGDFVSVVDMQLSRELSGSNV